MSQEPSAKKLRQARLSFSAVARPANQSASVNESAQVSVEKVDFSLQTFSKHDSRNVFFSGSQTVWWFFVLVVCNLKCVWWQIVDLPAGELKWLANHMGHEVDIHESVYRTHDSMVELTKISRLLMAVDAGRIAEFSGKTLKEVSLPGNIVLLCVS